MEKTNSAKLDADSEQRQRLLLLDRDGTILLEPDDEQIDSIDKLSFRKDCISSLRHICRMTNLRLVMVSNQDGLGTASFPESAFWPLQHLMERTLESEGIRFESVLIDPHTEADNAPTRKPGIEMLREPYLNHPETYDMANSWLIGDRDTDRQMAERLGCNFLMVDDERMPWSRIAQIVVGGRRSARLHRTTAETDIDLALNLDGSGKSHIDTGLPFFNHMLSQLPRHGQMNLDLTCKGDIDVSPHHTVEDCAIVLGSALRQCLSDSRGVERYAFVLPMDDSNVSLSLDLGGRAFLQWDVELSGQPIGGLAEPLFFHFFRSLTESAHINLAVCARGVDDHHQIEAVFKAFARALHRATLRDVEHMTIPSSKGSL